MRRQRAAGRAIGAARLRCELFDAAMRRQTAAGRAIAAARLNLASVFERQSMPRVAIREDTHWWLPSILKACVTWSSKRLCQEADNDDVLHERG